MDFAHYWFGGGGDNPIPFPISNSLRFRGSQYLERSVTTESNRAAWSFSCWMKRAKLDSVSVMFGVSGDSYNIEHLQFSNADVLNRYIEFGNQKSGYVSDSSKYRDPGAWYHVLWVNDMAQNPAANRTRAYVNGEQVTLNYNQAGAPSPAPASLINTVRTHFVGRGAYTGTSYPMYMAEVHFVDGSLLLPTDFGEYNDDGVWVPIEVTGLTYGTNGFYLDFSDPNNIGADRSGNGNNYTPVNFELTNTGSNDYDHMADSPTRNYSTLNPVMGSPVNRVNFSKANLTWSTNPLSGYAKEMVISSTIGVSEGKWYWEINGGVGAIGYSTEVTTNSDDGQGDEGGRYRSTGDFNVFGGNQVIPPSGASWNSDQLIGGALDLDNGTFTGYKNGVAQGTITGIDTSKTYFLRTFVESSASTQQGNTSFGARGWSETLPDGFAPLTASTLPDVAITNPSEHFTTILDTGANILGSAQAAFPNGLWWIKDRANSNQHQLIDSVRGTNSAITTPGNNGDQSYAAPSGNSVAWCWAVPGDGITNTNGTIQSIVAANVDSGFSIVAYSGNGTAGSTVGHGLSKAPDFILPKNRNTTANWHCYHSSLGGTKGILLNSPNPEATDPGFWNNTDPGDDVFTVGSYNAAVNAYVAYCWHAVPGFSAFGSYVGNGTSSGNGAFVCTGFRPAFILIKNTTTQDWMLLDSARDTYNPVQYFFHPNSVQKEYNSYGALVDFYSNGFKCRTNNDRINSGNSTFIYAAFAEHPFGGGNVAPSPAR